jgi:hypothetical protein
MSEQFISPEDQSLLRHLSQYADLYLVFQANPEGIVIHELFNLGRVLRVVIASVEKKRKSNSIPFQNDSVCWHLGRVKEFRAQVLSAISNQTRRTA